jgi:hypothetical protein
MSIDIEIAYKITSIAYNCTLVMLSFGAVVTYIKDKREKVSQHKHNFMTCTERYLRIQEMILSNDCLTHLNLSIYNTGRHVDKSDETLSKELALCGMMFQLMEDVWLMHDFDKENINSGLYSGWYALFCNWMKTKAIVEKWDLLRSHFSENFNNYVDKTFIKPQVEGGSEI